MMDDQTWHTWQRSWEWVLSSMKRKGAEVKIPEITPAVSRDSIRVLEEECGIVLPHEFIEVVTCFSSGVNFWWWLYGTPVAPLVPPVYREISWGGKELWDVKTLKVFKENHDGALQGLEEIEAEEIEAGRVDPDHPPGRIWHNKTVFIQVGNGDSIAFDTTHGKSDCPVVYLDHEWGDLNGSRLGLNFIDFITRWSNLGCPGPEGWHLEPFYDPTQNLLMDSGEVVDNWKRWVSE